MEASRECPVTELGGLDLELATLRNPELAYESSDKPESEDVWTGFKGVSIPSLLVSSGGGRSEIDRSTSSVMSVGDELRLASRDFNVDETKSAESKPVIPSDGRSRSEGLSGRGGGSLLSLLPGRVDSIFVSFCRRSRNASIPSDCPDVGGSGGGVSPGMPGFGEEERPTLRFEFAELRDPFDVFDSRCCRTLPLLPVLSWVPLRLCPYVILSIAGDVDALDALGLRSDVPSNGPGAIKSIRFETFSPPFVRGLSGANNGLGAAYLCWFVGSSRSRGRGLTGRGLALFEGKGGNAQSRLDVKSGDGGAMERGSGVVTLRFILKGDLGGIVAKRGERPLGSP